MTHKIFAICGATGHIGRVVVDDLLKRGYEVRALGRDEKKLHHLELKGAIPIQLDLDDSKALAEAFQDAYAVFVLIPPDYDQDDVGAYQDRIGEAIVQAIEQSGVKRVVNLSSVGAHLPDGTGFIKGLYRQEQRLNALEDLWMLIHLRPDYFMENLYSYLPMVEQGVIRSCLSGDLWIPMVATRDIGWKAADFLDNTQPDLHIVFEFGGPKDVDMNEVVALFGEAFDVPNLYYEQISYKEERDNLIQSGMKPGVVDMLVEMEKAFNDGLIKPTQELTEEHRGLTTLESFIQMIAHKTLTAIR